MTASEPWIKGADRIGKCTSPPCFCPVDLLIYLLIKEYKNAYQNCFKVFIVQTTCGIFQGLQISRVLMNVFINPLRFSLQVSIQLRFKRDKQTQSNKTFELLFVHQKYKPFGKILRSTAQETDHIESPLPFCKKFSSVH